MWSSVLNTLFPKQCLFCKKEESYCCEDCLSLISITRHPSPLSAQTNLSGLFCAASFQDRFVQHLIHNFKYPPFVRDLAHPLAYLIVSHFALLNNTIYPPDALIPIPLHKKRLKWRGYNHAEELAKHVGYAFSTPVITNVLTRTIYTNPQVNLNRKQRRKNMQGVFKIYNASEIKNKTILLIDDVYTTGATMEECARVLKKAGAKKVFGAVIARD
jgi:ComF family protein